MISRRRICEYKQDSAGGINDWGFNFRSTRQCVHPPKSENKHAPLSMQSNRDSVKGI
jgi:hypothetical protein